MGVKGVETCRVCGGHTGSAEPTVLYCAACEKAICDPAPKSPARPRRPALRPALARPQLLPKIAR